MFPVLELRLTLPSPQALWEGLSQLLLTFQPLGSWLAVTLAGALLWRNYILHLPAELPAGRYSLISGFYDPLTGVRLAAIDGLDHTDISEIVVAPSR